MFNLISSSYNSPIRQNQRNNINKTPILLNYPKLKPLNQDTVSFTSHNHNTTTIDNRKKILNIDLMKAFDNQQACLEVYNNASFVKGYLRKILSKNLNGMVVSKNNPTGIIEKIEIRVKTPDSIREKIADVLGNAIISEKPAAFNPNLKSEIKAHCTDLIGARIVMLKDGKRNCAKVINALLKEIEQGKLKITSIEHYVCQNGETQEGYFDERDLKRLEEAVNKQRKNKGLAPIEAKTKEKSSGYMALHIDVDLSSGNFKVKDNDYKGEIQVVGSDVCKFKEIEDLCYKIKSGKNIKGGDFSYAPFIRYFQSQMNTSKHPNLENDFKEYTKRAYIFQKKRNPDNNSKTYTFPTIEDCNMQGKIPKGLDFNVLSKVKLSCDRLYEISQAYSNN